MHRYHATLSQLPIDELPQGLPPEWYPEIPEEQQPPALPPVPGQEEPKTDWMPVAVVGGLALVALALIFAR